MPGKTKCDALRLGEGRVINGMILLGDFFFKTCRTSWRMTWQVQFWRTIAQQDPTRSVGACPLSKLLTFIELFHTVASWETDPWSIIFCINFGLDKSLTYCQSLCATAISQWAVAWDIYAAALRWEGATTLTIPGVVAPGASPLVPPLAAAAAAERVLPPVAFWQIKLHSANCYHRPTGQSGDIAAGLPAEGMMCSEIIFLCSWIVWKTIQSSRGSLFLWPGLVGHLDRRHPSLVSQNQNLLSTPIQSSLN